MQPSHLCPACEQPGMQPFHAVSGAPVHSVLLIPTREEALAFPRGEIELAFCPQCGFISNIRFDSSVHQYSERYEETQGFSPTFNAFHDRLAQAMIDRFGLRGKRVIEIGCGKGEFLARLVELGANDGLGFDPAFIPGRAPAVGAGQMRVVQDFYSERYAHETADFFACKMTLEHISDVANFMRTVRTAIGEQRDAVVFFQIPEMRRILAEVAFWDIYYEHCSYFTAGSLARLFRHTGFEVRDLWTDYDDQYLMIEARAAAGPHGAGQPLPQEEPAEALAAEVAAFQQAYQRHIAGWRSRLTHYREQERRVVLWGSGSKGVAFLTTLGVQDQIRYTVDINPHKHGTFMAGTGQEIVSPQFLTEYRPDVVILMNPIYRAEVTRDLANLGLAPEILNITDGWQ